MHPSTIRQRITTFLWFDTQAQEAAKFYVSIFPNSAIKTTTRNTGATPAPAGSVLSVTFELDGQEFVALNGGPMFKFTEAISLMVNCTTQEEVDRYYSILLAGGGQESQCGWLKDKFGLSWQITPVSLMRMIADTDPQRVDRVMREMMTMKKLDIAKLEAAYRREP